MNKYDVFTKSGGSRNYERVQADSFSVDVTGLITFVKNGRAIYWTSIHNLIEIILKD